mmetsp:Transcript_3284/g.6472  ORF Transcript_3284/g.6472 Transcript_3284/m.6472 type:complete len:248 (-) Transcript_3284:218-961(-)
MAHMKETRPYPSVDKGISNKRRPGSPRGRTRHASLKLSPPSVTSIVSKGAQKHVVSMKNVGSRDLAFRVFSSNESRVVARPSEGFICTGTKSRLVLISQPSPDMDLRKTIPPSFIIVEAAEISIDQLSKYGSAEFWTYGNPIVAFRTQLPCKWTTEDLLEPTNLESKYHEPETSAGELDESFESGFMTVGGESDDFARDGKSPVRKAGQHTWRHLGPGEQVGAPSLRRKNNWIDNLDDGDASTDFWI